MARRLGLVLLGNLLLMVVGCREAVRPGLAPQKSEPAPSRPAEVVKPFHNVRPAAVAGLFYPADPQDLAKAIDGYLAAAEGKPIGTLRGLVCPHAGYRYSGPVAAFAYRQLQDRKFATVIVMGPSHYATFDGAALLEGDALATPLGRTPLSPKIAALARQPSMSLHPNCLVQRPDWWPRSPIEPPTDGADTPHTWEHSVEVQFPFLQRTLHEFSAVPIVFGRVDPAVVADAIDQQLDDSTLIVASSDLSHYYPYDQAKELDRACVRAICDLDIARMQEQEACGKGPILALMHLARKKGWKTKLLDSRNSGDTSGDKGQVVGYAAIAFYAPDEAKRPAAAAGQLPAMDYGREQRQLLLHLARKSVAAAAAQATPPDVPDKVAAKLREHRACFVTLTLAGELRGCIGSLMPQEPLVEAVIRRRQSAATDDPRFPPVSPEEVAKVHIEISVLTIPRPLEFKSPEELLARLRPGVDGVVLSVGPNQATFLPQVWEQIPSKERFLASLCRKAGLDVEAWKSPKARVQTYQVEAFEEEAGGRD